MNLMMISTMISMMISMMLMMVSSGAADVTGIEGVVFDYDDYNDERS